jgi:hypothetical protein
MGIAHLGLAAVATMAIRATQISPIDWGVRLLDAMSASVNLQGPVTGQARPSIDGQCDFGRPWTGGEPK